MKVFLALVFRSNEKKSCIRADKQEFKIEFSQLLCREKMNKDYR